MKRQVLFKFITLVLVVPVFFTAHCAKPAELSDREVIVHLTGYLNSRMSGTQYKIDPAKTIVKPMGNNRYHITLKNTVFSTDLTGAIDVLLKSLSTSDEGHPERNEAQMEEVTLIYGPKENYLNLLSIKGMVVEGNFSPAQQKKNSFVFGGLDLNKFRVSVGEINFGDQGTDGTGSSETMEHLKLQLSGLTAKQDKISVILDIEKIGKTDTGKEDDAISSYFLDENAPPPDLKKALETGAAINDLTIQLGKINLSITKNDGSLCKGTIENASYLQFMKPDSDRKYFIFGNGLRISNMELTTPGNRQVQLFGNVKEFHFDYSVNNLSPEAALAFLGIMKISLTSRNAVESTKMSELTSQVMRFVSEVMKSKTNLHFSIAPFKHYFGEMEAEVNIRLYSVMAGPVLTLKATLFKAKDVIKNIREAGVFSLAAMKSIAGFIEKHGNKKENGDIFFIHEMDINQLREILFKEPPLVPPATRGPAGVL